MSNLIWTVNNGRKVYVADPAIPFEEILIRDFSYMLETALDYFVVSSYTYTDANGNHIGWLVPDVED